jgi:hypothetical protein
LVARTRCRRQPANLGVVVTQAGHEARPFRREASDLVFRQPAGLDQSLIDHQRVAADSLELFVLYDPMP